MMVSVVVYDASVKALRSRFVIPTGRFRCTIAV